MNSLQEAQNWERRLGLGQATIGALLIGTIIGGVTTSLVLGGITGVIVSGYGLKRLAKAQNITQDQIEGILSRKDKQITRWERNSG